MRKGRIQLIFSLLCIGTLLYWAFPRLNDTSEVDNLGSKWVQEIHWREVLASGIPGMSRNLTEQGLVVITPEWSWQLGAEQSLRFLTGVAISDLRTLFYDQIPYAQVIPITPSSVKAMSFPHFPKFEFKNFKLKDEPLVGIYHTHTAESFIPMSGVAHRPGGQRGDIVDVGDAMVKVLEKRGFSSIHSTQIHDYPSFMKAYGASEVTARKMLADHTSLQMLFDIHRDAGKKEDFTAVVNGVAVAKLLIVVGIGQADLIQPHWQQNHAFAKLVEAKLNEKYPGLCRGIELVDWRYNQHLHSRALLLEIGSQENTEAEVKASAEMFGDIIADILAENRE